MSATQDTKALREWRDSARYWEKHGQTIRLMFAPVTGALIADARIRQGHRVLDVAGGPGEPSLTIAELVGPSGYGIRKEHYSQAANSHIELIVVERKRVGRTVAELKIGEAAPLSLILCGRHHGWNTVGTCHHSCTTRSVARYKPWQA